MGSTWQATSAALLEELGAQGWELACATSSTSEYNYQLFFKRPKA